MDRDTLTKKQRWQIADLMAQDRLKALNAQCETVKVRDTFYTHYAKRVLDIFFSSIALLVTAPINIVLGIITYFDVGRPIFFCQERTGKDGKSFYIIKFRNMTNEKDERGELLPPAQRVTKFGKFVRKTSLDELLNFWSILKGDMSIIGPRPLVPEYVHRYNARHRQRLSVRPGLECPPHNMKQDVCTWQQQFENDVWYVENISFLTDCKMLINLFRLAIDRKSTKVRAAAGRGVFMGYDKNGQAISLKDVPQEYIDRVA